jgi:hypothetical protein
MAPTNRKPTIHNPKNINVLQALAESVKEADAGKVHDARKAVARLVDELKSR